MTPVIVSGIFVSYRRDDSQGFAGRLADDLSDRFGDARVFRDVEIRPGMDFTRVIKDAIGCCNLLLVVIGRRWMEASDNSGRPRLFDPQDWVRLEIEAALEGRKSIIPVLVGGAEMPAEDALPESIRFLTRLQASVVADRRWQYDMARLGEITAGVLGEPIAARQGEPAPAAAGAVSRERSPLDLLLREMGSILAAERERRRRQAVAESRPLAVSLGYLFKGVKQLLASGILIVIGYFLIQHYGDPSLKRAVDDLLRFLSGLLPMG